MQPRDKEKLHLMWTLNLWIIIATLALGTTLSLSLWIIIVVTLAFIGILINFTRDYVLKMTTIYIDGLLVKLMGNVLVKLMGMFQK
jgi:hypothetical protein